MTAYSRPIDFTDAAVHQATGMISVQLECDIDNAFRALFDAAADREMSVTCLARRIVARTIRLAPEVGSVDLVRADGTAVLYLRGEVDMALADRLEAAIAEGMGGHRLVFDLTHATFIDSTVINALVAAHHDAAITDTSLTLVPGPDAVMRTLAVSGVDVLFMDSADPQARP
jgi:stage II sporulation protein AA (anti-sigma F factor antagonist)